MPPDLGPPNVDESWNVIVDWLGRHSPPELALIRPPAAEGDLRSVEERVGTALPDDLVAWWRRADGLARKGGLLPPFYSPYPVRAALRSRDVWMTAWNAVMEESTPGQFAAYLAQENEAPAGSPCKGAWLPRWLPIAGDGGGNDLFVDLRPGPARGCVRQFLRDDGAGDTAWWSSVSAMLSEVADALTRETPIRGSRIWVEDDGAISWDTDRSRWSGGGSTPVNVARLRERYAMFVEEARAGGFNSRHAAARIAAHVVRNTELLITTTQAVLADDPAGREQQRSAAWAAKDWTRFREVTASAEQAAANIRYDNSDAMDPATLDRYAANGPAALADRIEQLGTQLCDLVAPLNQGRPAAHVRIVEDGVTILDERQGWLGVLNALWVRQLPLRTRQLRALR
jgi:cell wall assembly regulator SMI1